jgi:hypothetical protein
MDLKEISWEGGEWINLAQNRNQWWVPVNMVNEPLGSVTGKEFID